MAPGGVEADLLFVGPGRLRFRWFQKTSKIGLENLCYRLQLRDIEAPLFGPPSKYGLTAHSKPSSKFRVRYPLGIHMFRDVEGIRFPVLGRNEVVPFPLSGHGLDFVWMLPVRKQ